MVGALFSLSGVTIGLVVATITMPTDVVMEGALRVPAIALALGILVGPAYAIYTRGFQGLLRAEHLVSIAVVYFVLLDLIQGLYPVQLTQESVQAGYMLVALFCAALVAGTTLGPAPLGRVLNLARTIEFTPTPLFLIATICFLASMFGYAYPSDFSIETMINGLKAGRADASWNRSALGGWNAFADFLPYFGYLLPVLLVMLTMKRHTWFRPDVFCVLLFTAIATAFQAQSGGRRTVGAIVIAGLVTWICGLGPKVRLRHLMILGATVGLTLVIMDMILENRNHGAGNFSYELNRFQGVRVDDNFVRLGQMVEAIPKSYDHPGFEWLIYVLVRPVPRVLWPDKPTDPGFNLTDHLRQTNITYSTSVIGEWYMGFGWIGVLIGGLGTGFAARTWSQLLDSPLSVAGSGLYGVGVLSFVVGVRSFIEVILMSYPLLCWLAVIYLISLFRSVAQPVSHGSTA